MTTPRPHTTLRGPVTVALVLIGALLGTACDGGSPRPSAVPTTTVASGAPRAATVVAPAGSTIKGNLDCQALANAALDLNSSEPFLVLLMGGGSAVNRVDSPFYVDTAKLRTDLNVLVALPDPTSAAEITLMGKPSEAIPQFRQLFDSIDAYAAANAGPTPDSTATNPTSVSDQQLRDFGVKFVKMSVALNSAMGNACPGVSANVPQAQAPGAPATPLPASYQIGQTAPVGDLRVTLDRVATLPGADANLPAPGNRFVFVYLTVENTGQTAFAVNTLTGTHWEDAAGKQYFGDPFSVGLDPNATNFEGDIQPGTKRSGAIGYQLPMNAGDMVWVFQDFRPNRAVFAVKAGDVATVGTPVTEPTEDALRAGAAATQTAFVEMILGADATKQAVGTETPAPVEPTETLAPPEPTDIPATLEPPEDTPTASP